MKHTNKKCAVCLYSKSPELFYKNCKSPDKLSYYCKLCANTTISSRWGKLLSTAKKRGIPVDLTRKEYELIIKEPCFYCKGTLGAVTTGCGLDRTDNSKGYIFGNVVSCCKTCNVIKGHQFSIVEARVMVEALLNYRND